MTGRVSGYFTRENGVSKIYPGREIVYTLCQREGKGSGRIFLEISPIAEKKRSHHRGLTTLTRFLLPHKMDEVLYISGKEAPATAEPGPAQSAAPANPL